MAPIVANITSPISLCAYVVSLVFGLLARNWNSTSERPRDRWLRYFAATLSVAAVAGGLVLAWNQQAIPTESTPSVAVKQSSSGNQSPNVVSSGSGAVTVQSGATPAPPPAKSDSKKK